MSTKLEVWSRSYRFTFDKHFYIESALLVCPIHLGNLRQNKAVSSYIHLGNISYYMIFHNLLLLSIEVCHIILPHPAYRYLASHSCVHNQISHQAISALLKNDKIGWMFLQCAYFHI